MHKKSLLLLLLTLLLFSVSQAQNVFELLNDTAVVKAEETPSTAAPIMAKKWNNIESKYFTMNIGVAMFLDHNIVNQDDNNIEQVGDIGPATEFRAERKLLSGSLKFSKHPWRYMISGNYTKANKKDGAGNQILMPRNMNHDCVFFLSFDFI